MSLHVDFINGFFVAVLIDRMEYITIGNETTYDSNFTKLADIWQPWNFKCGFLSGFCLKTTYNYQISYNILQEPRWIFIGEANFHHLDRQWKMMKMGFVYENSSLFLQHILWKLMGLCYFHVKSYKKHTFKISGLP